MAYAKLVLPVPGGPHNKTETELVDPGVARVRNGEPAVNSFCCPETSSRVRGRIRTARGAVDSPNPCEPVSMTQDYRSAFAAPT